MQDIDSDTDIDMVDIDMVDINIVDINIGNDSGADTTLQTFDHDR